MAYNSQSQWGWQDIKGGRVGVMLAVRGIKSGCMSVQDGYNDTWTMSYASGISESGAQQSRMTPSHLNTRHSKNSVEQERGTFGWMDGISSRVPWLSMVHDTAPFHNMTIQYTNTPWHHMTPFHNAIAWHPTSIVPFNTTPIQYHTMQYQSIPTTQHSE